MNELEFKKVIKWFASDDKGRSSECLIYFLCTNEIISNNYPGDVVHLGRCIRALDKLSFLKSNLINAKKISKEWGFIIDNWEFLIESFNNKKYERVTSILKIAHLLCNIN